ncbi:MAG: hypothetical protein M3A44_09215 [Gammaproteobacteria bacterium]
MLVFGVFITVWFAMILYWRASNQMPTPSDVVLYLLAIPAALLAALWLILKGVAVFSAKSDDHTAASQIKPDAEALAQAQTAQQERALTLIILASALRAAHGQSADELTSALASKKAKLGLDSELKNGDGYPILSGRIESVDEDAQRKAISAWLATRNMQEIIWTSEQLRAQALGSEVVIELAQQAITHPQLESYMATPPSKRSTMVLPTLQLRALLPTHWEAEKRKITAEWFIHLIEQQGWPSEKIALKPELPNDHMAPISMVDRLSVDSYRQSLPCFGMVLACESHIGELTVSDWENTGRLFTGASNHGQIPGEGAAGLLLADAQQATLINPKSAAKTNRIAQNRREKSADDRGRSSAETLTALTKDAFLVAAINPEKITLVTADTDLRTSRVAELMKMGVATFPDLDLSTQCFKIAASCGSAGAVSSLTALALAHHEAAENSNFALCVNNQDGFARAAVIVSPWIPETTSLQTAT